MSYRCCILCFFLISGIGIPCFSQQETPLSVIPAPLNSVIGNGSFQFSASTIIRVKTKDKKAVASLKNYLLTHWGYKNQIVSNSSHQPYASVLELTEEGTAGFDNEEYELKVNPEKIVVKGKTAGLFYGIQTLIQLFPKWRSETAKLPCVSIKDRPRFGYRGLMLDVSRHFFSVQEIKDLLDLMAAYKLNTFHWHLTDDQGWRLEIKKYPKLTTIGAWRVPRAGDFNKVETLAPQPGELSTDGGFYTQDQVKEIIQYATDRFINIIPEIDIPGHCMAMIAAYPELSCTKDTSIKVNPGSSFAKWYPNGTYEMFVDNTLNPAGEKVYHFLNNVFDEVALLFPYQYVHIGGDECFKGFWEKDRQVQAFMRKNKIKSVQEMQYYFTGKIIQMLQQKGKKVIGWDEVAENKAIPQLTIMNRYGDQKMREQLDKNLPVIITSSKYGLYFDYAQSASAEEPINHGGNCSLQQLYSFDSYVDDVDTMNNVLGIQGCIWTEHIATVSKLQYMMIPRIFALSEIGWTFPEKKNYENFYRIRVSNQLRSFDSLGIHFRVPPATTYIDTILHGREFSLFFEPPFKGCKIYYTIGGRNPGDTDKELSKPVVVRLLPDQKTELKTIVVTPSGKRSVITKTVLSYK